MHYLNRVASIGSTLVPLNIAATPAFKLKFSLFCVIALTNCICFYNEAEDLLTGAKTHSPCLFKPMIFKGMYKVLLY